MATADAGTGGVGCPGFPLDLSGSGSGTGNLSYSWNPGTGLSNSGIASPTATPSQTTIYTLTVSSDSGAGCEDTDEVTVFFPAVDDVDNQAYCTGSDALISFSDPGSTPGVSFAWTNDNTAIGLGASGNGNLSFTTTNI